MRTTLRRSFSLPVCGRKRRWRTTATGTRTGPSRRQPRRSSGSVCGRRRRRGARPPVCPRRESSGSWSCCSSPWSSPSTTILPWPSLVSESRRRCDTRVFRADNQYIILGRKKKPNEPRENGWTTGSKHVRQELTSNKRHTLLRRSCRTMVSWWCCGGTTAATVSAVHGEHVRTVRRRAYRLFRIEAG